MADIVNLRQFRKQKARAKREQQADENRHIHGRTKVEKIFENRAQKHSEQFLDKNRMEPNLEELKDET